MYLFRNNNLIKKYDFKSYIKGVGSVYFVQKRIKFNSTYLLFKLNYLHMSYTFSYYFLRNKNWFYQEQLLFMIKSSLKQYFLSVIGLNTIHFKTVSTGKLLSKNNLPIKALKNSIRANKYLLQFFNEYYSNQSIFISHYLLKPITRKNLNFFYLILKTYKIISDFVGFKNYYQCTFKGVKRIKKRIKKKLLNNNIYYS